jgi:protoheme IX farnesyltransferase
LVGWAAVTNSLAWTPWLLFLLIFLWTPPHFWALAIRHSEEYRAANVPMLPVVVEPKKVVAAMIRYTVALVACSMAVIPVADMGWIYGISAGAVGAAFLWGTIALTRVNTPAAAMKLFSFSITYISVLFVALTVDVLLR